MDGQTGESIQICFTLDMGNLSLTLFAACMIIFGNPRKIYAKADLEVSCDEGTRYRESNHLICQIA